VFSSLNPLTPGHLKLNLYENDQGGNFRPNVSAPDALRTLTYGSLIDVLLDRGGYREYQVNGDPSLRTKDGCDVAGQKVNAPTLFIFAYDWRKSMDENAALLKGYIDCVQRFYPDTKVDLLAHSMGGLLARRYILANPSAHKVDRMITIGSPWLGAPKVLHIMQTGNWFFGQPIFNSTVRYIAGSMPGVHQLLPGRSYFELIDRLPPRPDKLYPLVEDGVDLNRDGIPVQTHNIYPRYRELINDLYGRDSTGQQVPAGPGQVFSPGTTADSFHDFPFISLNNQDDWQGDQSGVRYVHIFGVRSWVDTLGRMRAMLSRSCQFLPMQSGVQCLPSIASFRPAYTRGDGTVPLISAMRQVGGPSPLNLNAPGAELIPINGSTLDLNQGADHLGLVKNAEVHDRLLKLLSNAEGPGSASIRPVLEARSVKLADATPPADPIYYLTITGVTSVTVSDDSGNTSTPTQLAPQGGLPQVTVMEIGDRVYALTIPVGGPYTVFFEKTANPLTIEMLTGTGDTTTQAIRYLDLDDNLQQLPAGTKADLRLTPTAVENLRYDSNNDGVLNAQDAHLSPTLSLTDAHAGDTTAPTIDIGLEANGNKLLVTLDAQDASGIRVTGPLGAKAIYYSTNNTDFQQYAGPFQGDPATTLYVFADDAVGNRAVVERLLPAADMLPELNVSLTVAHATVQTGSPLAYNVRVANTGRGRARSVMVDFALPGELDFDSCVGVSCPSGGGGGSRSVALGNLQAGDAVTFTVMTTVRCEVADQTPIDLTLTLTSADTPRRSATQNVLAINPAPVISHADVMATAPANACSAIVSYSPASDPNCMAGLKVACTPPSGSSFPIGTTSVTCTATDTGGIVVTGSFAVKVMPATPSGSDCGETPIRRG
jgi:hypothetical protein